MVALSIPTTLRGGRPFPERDLILAITALTISVGPVQGLTLRLVVERAGFREGKDEREEAAERQAVEAALARPEAEHPTTRSGRQALVPCASAITIGDEVLIHDAPSRI